MTEKFICSKHQYWYCCLLLLLQIVNVIQVNRFIAVCGPSSCGKTAAIQAAAETLRQSSGISLPCYVSTTTVALNAMREEQLLGYQDNDGCVVLLLPLPFFSPSTALFSLFFSVCFVLFFPFPPFFPFHFTCTFYSPYLLHFLPAPL